MILYMIFASVLLNKLETNTVHLAIMVIILINLINILQFISIITKQVVQHLFLVHSTEDEPMKYRIR